MQIYKIIILLLILTTSYAHAAEEYQSEWVSGHVADIKKDRDSVLIQIQFELNHLLSPNELMQITPLLSGENRLYVLPSLILAGKKQYKLLGRNISLLSESDRTNYSQQVAAIRSVRKNPVTEFYEMALPFEKWMIGAELSFTSRTCDCCNELITQDKAFSDRIALQKHILPELRSAGIQDTITKISQPLAATPDTLFMTFTHEFKYRRSESVLDLSFRDNQQEWDSLKDLLYSLSTGKAEITDISIKSYASPEGIYLYNQQLSDDRAKEFRKLLQSNFRLDDQITDVRSLGEDWDGLITLLEKESPQYKDNVIRLIRSTGIFHGRERKLMDLNYGKSYSEMKDHLFPELRRVRIELKYKITN